MKIAINYVIDCGASIHAPWIVRKSTTEEPNYQQAGHTKTLNRNVEYHSIKGDLHERLIDELNEEGALSLEDGELKPRIDEFVERILETEDIPLNESERSRIASDLLEETLGTGPLAPLMADPAVTDILVNRFDEVFVERFGVLQQTEIRFQDDEHLIRIISRIASRVGRRIDTSTPMVDARLPDGSRVNATLPPITIDGPTLSIRRFGRKRLTAATCCDWACSPNRWIDSWRLSSEIERASWSPAEPATENRLSSAIAEAIPIANASSPLRMLPN